MTLIEWKEEYSVGIPDVDHEHRQLIDLINELYEALIRADSQLRIADFLGEIYANISAHFALEEKIMREKKYDQYEDHKADHELLLDEIRDIMDEHETDPDFGEKQLANILGDWFTAHFKTKDARLHKHLG